MTLNNFKYCYGDFETMLLDTGLTDGVVLRCWVDEETPIFKCIIGYTKLPSDILLHLVDVEGYGEYDIDKILKQDGVELILLSRFVNEYGISITPEDQFGYEP